MMHVLHIANDYAGSRVYSRLVAALDACGLHQSVFTVARRGAIGSNSRIRGREFTTRIISVGIIVCYLERSREATTRRCEPM